MAADYAGNTPKQARQISLTSTPRTYKDRVGSLDTNDYYSFTLGKRSSVKLALKGLNANADMALISKSRSQPTRRSTRSSNQGEAINQVLDAGTYYVRVYPRSGNVGYQLSVSASAVKSYQRYTFKYSYGNGDYYTGYGYSTSDRYRSGQQITYSNSDSSGYTGSYQITSAVNYTGTTQNLDKLRVNSYYDSERNDSYPPFFGYGSSGLGSESGYITKTSNFFDNKTEADPTEDWFGNTLRDAGLRFATRSRFLDSKLDRNDMITIFRDAKDGGAIDSTELNDLRTLTSDKSYVAMDDHVRVLSSKVVNSNEANSQYQGKALGNLFAGSSDVHLEKLVNKWFLGSDRPAAANTYRYANGSLFQNGVSYQDIKQGKASNCYFLGGLAATAIRSPNSIQDMFIDNGDNTYTVRFFNQGVADYVTVDQYLPVASSGQFTYASQGGYYNRTSTELWVALAEKAYAQVNSSGWTYRWNNDHSNSYQGINNGWFGDAIRDITAKSSSIRNSLNFDTLVNAFAAGKMIGVNSKASGQISSTVVYNHVYVLTDYNSSTQKFTLFNPWGVSGGYENGSSKPGTLNITWNELTANFSSWDSSVS
ncbi:pre-peptidase C-terminal domain-containing protein [Oculatella sp. FACHB-28]|uniref:C2 family cysteine protease n=1 Tax=Oculatella sp. FACHB-28 TaxID=2692845 RepID=UPI00168993E1|nr:C2 family cysteine protease [Oculatella sp. FACHB-28]MBD2056675.1 pre-peptidase C-terminal domain-containing protein [Oculatella sp. FACHB-28]